MTLTNEQRALTTGKEKEMIEKLVVFTHSDLDALGCMLNIERKFPDIHKRFFYTNYANIPEQVFEIKQFIEEHEVKHMIIADVSFSDNKQYLRELYDTGVNIVYVDHHLYPDGFFNDFPRMKITWDKTRSATLLCYDLFQNKHVELGRLSAFIDIYDLWQVDNSFFEQSQLLNSYFWKYDIYDLFKAIVKNDYKMPDNYESVTRKIDEERKLALETYETSNRLFRANDVTFAFIEKLWFNEVLINEMKNGQNVVIGITDYGIVRVRISEKADISDEFKNKIRLELTGTENIGHMNAFTYKCDEKNLFTEAKKLGKMFAER